PSLEAIAPVISSGPNRTLPRARMFLFRANLVPKVFLLLGVSLSLTITGSVSVMQSRESHGSSDDAGADADWSELSANMGNMHMSMAAVRPLKDSDSNFVDLMLPHHQAAIDMAKTQLKYGSDPQMRRLAQEIITDQQSEIELMRLWLKQRNNANAQRPTRNYGR